MPPDRSAESAELALEIQTTGLKLGLCAVGFASAAPFDGTKRLLLERSSLGYFARMKFVMADPDRSCDPAMTLPGAMTIISGALGYRGQEGSPPSELHVRVAGYARRDYYSDLTAILQRLAAILEQGGYRAAVVADSNALVDRAAAARASIGHFGKNSNVITKNHGSWVVIGSIITDAALPASTQDDAACGTCVACIKTCPTGAIVEPGVIDARRCIAYLLQAPGAMPIEHRRAIGNRIYGCDDCQEHCPAGRTPSHNAGQAPGGREDLKGGWISAPSILATPNDALARRFRHFYMPRNDYDYLKRNALVALGNSREASAAKQVLPFLGHSRPLLRSHAAWALGELHQPAAADGLRAMLGKERDESVREEILLALGKGKS